METLQEHEQKYAYYLHFIGRHLYGKEAFIQEARKFGVRRILPENIVKNLRWGDPILLAVYDKERKEAEVFGYFTVDKISPVFENPEAEKELLSKLKVVKVSRGGAGMRINRRCGSYILGSTYYVANTVEEIVDSAKKIKEERGVKVKWFIEGHLKLFKKPFRVKTAFTRSAAKIELEKPIYEIESEEVAPKVQTVKEYRQRRYLPKKVRVHASLDWF